VALYAFRKYDKPVNQLHFEKLIRDLTNEYWSENFETLRIVSESGTEATVLLKITEHSASIAIFMFSTNVNNDCINGEELENAIEVIDRSETNLDLGFLCSATDETETLSSRLSNFNEQRVADGKCEIRFLGWSDIQEMLATCPKTVQKYVDTGRRENKLWTGTGLIDLGAKLKEPTSGRVLSSKKKSRAAPPDPPMSVFSDDEINAFEDYAADQVGKNRVQWFDLKNDPSMGHLIGLSLTEQHFEIWMLSRNHAQNQDLPDEERKWISEAIRGEFQKNYLKLRIKSLRTQIWPTIQLRFFEVLEDQLTPFFDRIPVTRSLDWLDINPNVPFDKLLPHAATTELLNKTVLVTQFCSLLGTQITEEYEIPFESISFGVIKNILQFRTFPRIVVHSHKRSVGWLDRDYCYVRTMDEFEKHYQIVVRKNSGKSKRVLCQSCQNCIVAYPGESDCMNCYLRNQHSATSLTETLSQIFSEHINRMPWDIQNAAASL
jgi:hypothetical protein